MGTACITTIREGGVDLARIYRQSDGYPTGHGKELKEILGSMKIVNGFQSEMEMGEYANGLGCMAAQLVARLKKRIGGIYLEPSDEYWSYLLEADIGGQIILTVYADGKPVFGGPIGEFDPEAVERCG